jgi:hypothetical protein
MLAALLAIGLSACSGKQAQSQNGDNATSGDSSGTSSSDKAQAPSTVQVPAGTSVVVRLNESLASDTSQAGQEFKGEIASPVVVDGKPVIPKSAQVRGTVVAADSAGHFRGRSQLGLRLTEVSYNGESYSIKSNEWSRVGPARGKRSAEMIGGGAGVGALVGALIGHGKGAAIGAAAGAGGGAAIQASTKPAQVKLPAESLVKFRLTSSVEVKPATTRFN